MQLGNHLADARRKNGLSQEEVAEKLGVSRQTISKWETSETLPDIQQAKHLSVLYHLTLDELIDFDLDLKEIEEAIGRVSEEKQQNIDWTSVWRKQYPVLLSYPQTVAVDGYAENLRALLDDLKRRYHYSNLDAMLVLKDILSHVWNKKG